MVRNHQRCRGVSFVEVAISITVFAALGTGIFTIISDTSGVFQSSVIASQRRSDSIEAMTQLQRELSQASPSTLVVDQTDANTDIIQFQIPVAVVGETIVWGAEDVAGQMLEYRLTNQINSSALQLVRRVLSDTGAIIDEQVLGRNLDGVDNDGKAFSVTVDDSLITLNLRFLMTHAETEGQIDDDIPRRTTTAVIRLRSQ